MLNSDKINGIKGQGSTFLVWWRWRWTGGGNLAFVKHFHPVLICFCWRRYGITEFEISSFMVFILLSQNLENFVSFPLNLEAAHLLQIPNDVCKSFKSYDWGWRVMCSSVATWTLAQWVCVYWLLHHWFSDPGQSIGYCLQGGLNMFNLAIENDKKESNHCPSMMSLSCIAALTSHVNFSFVRCGWLRCINCSCQKGNAFGPSSSIVSNAQS